MARILIIDDDELMLNALTNLLQDEGYNLMITADGPRGIELYRKEKPDVVLLDLGLPSVSGLDVLKEIKQIDPNAKVIIITGYPSEQMMEEAMKSGAFAFYEKPGVISKIMRVIKNALGA